MLNIAVVVGMVMNLSTKHERSILGTKPHSPQISYYIKILLALVSIKPVAMETKPLPPFCQ